MESISLQILTDIFIPFLLAFSISFGALRRAFNEKIAMLIAFVFGIFFLYYQNVITKSQIFASFVVYTLITLMALSIGTILIFGERINPKIATWIFLLTMIGMAFYTFMPFQMESVSEEFTGIVGIVSPSDIIVIGILLVMIGTIYFVGKEEGGRGESAMDKLKKLAKEILGLK